MSDKYFADGGLYIEGVHSYIPAGAALISDEQYAQILAAPSELKVVQSDADGNPIIIELPSPSIEQQKAVALQIINREASAAIGFINASYPQFEIDTWDAQESEARAWLQNNSAPTPTLTQIALARGITMAELAARVIAKADLFRPLVAGLIGKRQALEDQLTAATDAVGINAVIALARDASTWGIQ